MSCIGEALKPESTIVCASNFSMLTCCFTCFGVFLFENFLFCSDIRSVLSSFAGDLSLSTQKSLFANSSKLKSFHLQKTTMKDARGIMHLIATRQARKARKKLSCSMVFFCLFSVFFFSLCWPPNACRVVQHNCAWFQNHSTVVMVVHDLPFGSFQICCSVHSKADEPSSCSLALTCNHPRQTKHLCHSDHR